MPEPQILEDAREYLTLLHRRRALILTCVVVCLLTATLYNYTARPLYQATTQLLIDPGTPNIISGRELVPGEGTGSEYYQTQYELLRGRPLLEKAVQRLGPAASAEFARGPLLSPWIRLRRMLSAEGRMAVDARGAPFSPAVEAYRSRLTIQPVAGSRLVNLHFNAYDPELAALAVNALAQLYIEQSLEFRFTTSSEATGWLSERLQEQQKKLEDAEKALQSFREHEGFVAGEERPDVVDQRLVTLTGARRPDERPHRAHRERDRVESDEGDVGAGAARLFSRGRQPAHPGSPHPHRGAGRGGGASGRDPGREAPGHGEAPRPPRKPRGPARE
jgi:succinoglycan biosynthesis transport protein ExoP